MVMFLMDNPAE